MTVFDTTRRDLAAVYDWAFIPMNWDKVTEGDTVLSGKDGMTWQVAGPPDKQHDVVTVRLQSGRREWVGDVPRYDGVHVLEDPTGWRRTEYEGGTPVRQRKGAKRSD